MARAVLRRSLMTTSSLGTSTAGDSLLDRLGRSGPGERAMVSGLGSLGDGELVAILLGTGIAAQPVTLLAERLLITAGGLTGLSRLGPIALAELPGLGPAKALRLSAA